MDDCLLLFLRRQELQRLGFRTTHIHAIENLLAYTGMKGEYGFLKLYDDYIVRLLGRPRAQWIDLRNTMVCQGVILRRGFDPSGPPRRPVYEFAPWMRQAEPAVAHVQAWEDEASKSPSAHRTPGTESTDSVPGRIRTAKYRWKKQYAADHGHPPTTEEEDAWTLARWGDVTRNAPLPGEDVTASHGENVTQQPTSQGAESVPSQVTDASLLLLFESNSKQQQQTNGVTSHAEPSGVEASGVTSPDVTPLPTPAWTQEAHAAAVKALTQAGLTYKVAKDMVKLSGPTCCIQQAQWLPYRNHNPEAGEKGGFLVTAIKEGWTEPEKSVEARLKAEHEQEQQRKDAAKQDAARLKAEQEQAQEHALEAYLRGRNETQIRADEAEIDRRFDAKNHIFYTRWRNGEESHIVTQVRRGFEIEVCLERMQQSNGTGPPAAPEPEVVEPTGAEREQEEAEVRAACAHLSLPQEAPS